MAGNSTTRVALVTSSLRLAGAEKQTMYIARALHEAKLELTCFFLGERGHYETALGQIGIHVRKIYKQNRPWSILVRLITGFYEFRPHIMFAPQFGDLLQGGDFGRADRAGCRCQG